MDLPPQVRWAAHGISKQSSSSSSSAASSSPDMAALLLDTGPMIWTTSAGPGVCQSVFVGLMQTIWYVASPPVAGVEGKGLDGGVVFGDGVQVAGSDVCARGVVGGVIDILGVYFDGLLR